MSIKGYFENMKNIEETLLRFLDQGDHLEENYENFMNILKNQYILKDKHDFKIILYLIVKISNNHHRYYDFNTKIEQILLIIKKEIKKFYSNEEIFNIFKNSKQILLFLIDENIITIDQNIYQEIMNNSNKRKRYPEYFSPEIKTFVEKEINGKENQFEKKFITKQFCDSDLYNKIQKVLKVNYAEFNEKRKNGLNDDHLSKIIQNDLIEEFIIYVNKENCSLNSSIEQSIYDTNEFLLEQNETNLIEYAAFYGSTQIFKYLYKNNAKITSKLWLYAIHGYDEEIIHLLEEKNIKLKYEECIKESIKCHHFYVTHYIEKNFKHKKKCKKILSYGFQYYNFIYITDHYINDDFFMHACKFDYYKIVEFLLYTKNINVNNEKIFNYVYL